MSEIVIKMTVRCDSCGILFFGRFIDRECGLCE